MKKTLVGIAGLVAVVCFAAPARADWFGIGRARCCPTPTCPPQPCAVVCQPVEKTVYETVWVQELVPCVKTVCETVWRDVEKTCYRTVRETQYRECKRVVCKPVQETVMQECRQTVCRVVECGQWLFDPCTGCCRYVPGAVKQVQVQS
jgi:hypothetical protein